MITFNGTRRFYYKITDKITYYIYDEYYEYKLTKNQINNDITIFKKDPLKIKKSFTLKEFNNFLYRIPNQYYIKISKNVFILRKKYSCDINSNHFYIDTLCYNSPIYQLYKTAKIEYIENKLFTSDNKFDDTINEYIKNDLMKNKLLLLLNYCYHP